MTKKDVFVSRHQSIKDALKKLENTAEKVLLVTDQDRKLLGTITDGDIRSYLLKGKSLDDDINDVYFKTPTVLKKGKFTMDEVRAIFLKKKLDLIPVLDQKGIVVDYMLWSQAFSEQVRPVKSVKIRVPVVIMAGGKGTRLEPFTKILPKPLIPVNDKPILEVILDEFSRQGANKYHLVLNYKGEMIEAYFKGCEKKFNLNYVWEKKFLGTAGGLKLIENLDSDLFIVSNCDVIVRAEFAEVIKLHKKQRASMTVLSSIQHHKIPYGVIDFKDKGEVTGIQEKPEYTVTINTGVYVINRDALEYIPDDEYFDMTDFIQVLLDKNMKVITYPVNSNDYIDIGQWEEYKISVEKLQGMR
ncbi:MAG: NTP transferase domain-containing protein [Nitrospira sp.]|nr:NTP transferase domain-containing protein [bacterium]MBL7048018.1 NTP transferase domain-containing protein [Nitrospira sp.]